jgi:Ribosomal protein L21e
MFKRGFKGTINPLERSWIEDLNLHILFADHGPVKMSTYLINYRVGDIVDIKANSAQQRGMPHKYYHGYVRSYNYNVYIHKCHM